MHHEKLSNIALRTVSDKLLVVENYGQLNFSHPRHVVVED